MNANEYINGMADLLRTTGVDVREQGLILAMTDDEEYARNEVAEFVGRF